MSKVVQIEIWLTKGKTLICDYCYYYYYCQIDSTCELFTKFSFSFYSKKNKIVAIENIKGVNGVL